MHLLYIVFVLPKLNLCIYFKNITSRKQSSKYTWRLSFEDIINEIGDITSDKNSKLIMGRFPQESLLFNNADVIETLLILNAVSLKWMGQCCSSCKWLRFMLNDSANLLVMI